MARIDLSQLNINPIEMGRTQQVFSNEGAGAYGALANLGGTVASVANELYAKQQDIDTDREAMAEREKYSKEEAEKRSWALINIDKDTNKVLGTEDSFDQYMFKFREEKYNESMEALKQPMTKAKFEMSMRPQIEKANVNDIYTSVEKTKENVLVNWKKKSSLASDSIMLASSYNTESNYAKALSDMELEIPLLEKTLGIHGASIARDYRAKELLDTKFNTILRNAESLNPADSAMAAQSFMNTMGPAVMFKDFDEYKGYVQAKANEWYSEGPNKEAEQAIKVAMEDLLGPEAANSFVTMKADPNIELLSSEEKTKTLDKFLSIKFKNTKAKGDDMGRRLTDWEHNIDAVGEPRHINELANLSKEGKFNTEKKLRLIMTASDLAVEKYAKDAYIQGGDKTKEQWENIINKNRQVYMDTYASAVMSQEEYRAELAKEKSTGSKSKADLLQKLHASAEKWRTEMNSNPMGAVVKTEQYTTLFNSAFPRAKSGEFLVNPQGIASLNDFTKKTLSSIGTRAAVIDSYKVMPDGNLKDLFTQLKTQTPAQQTSFYESMNSAVPEIKLNFYKQAMQSGELTLQQANMFANMRPTDSAAKRAIMNGIIATDNKYTGAGFTEYIKENLLVEGMWGIDYDFDTVNKELNSLLKGNEYLNNLKKVASASGIDGDHIQIMYGTENIRKAVLIEAAKDSSLTGVATTIQGHLAPIVDRLMKEYYDGETVIGDSLKTVIPKDFKIKKDILLNNSEKAIDSVKDKLSKGIYKIDFSDYESMKFAEKESKMSQDTKQRIFTKDVMDDLAFVSTDTTGAYPGLHLMFKSRDGRHYRLNIIDGSGKGKPVIIRPEDLRDEKTFEDKLNRFNSPTDFGKEKKQYIKPMEMKLPPKIEKRSVAYDMVAKNMMKYEGFRGNSYSSLEGGDSTTGFGHKNSPGKEVKKHLSYKEGVELLYKDIADHDRDLQKELKVNINDEMRAALIDMYLNVKPSGRTGTMNLVNQGRFDEAAANMKLLIGHEDPKNKGKNIVRKGLIKRATERAEMFLNGAKKMKNEETMFSNFKEMY